MSEPQSELMQWRAAAEREVKGAALTPRRLGLGDYLSAALQGSWDRVRRVPGSAITEDGVDDEGDFAFVACPCGAHPVVRDKVEKCPGCERWYLLVALGSVWVIYGEMTPPRPVGGTA